MSGAECAQKVRDYFNQANLEAFKFEVEYNGFPLNCTTWVMGFEPLKYAIQAGYMEAVQYIHLEEVKRYGKQTSRQLEKYIEHAESYAEDGIADWLRSQVSDLESLKVPETKMNQSRAMKSAISGDLDTLKACFEHVREEAAERHDSGTVTHMEKDDYVAYRLKDFLDNTMHAVGFSNSPDGVHHEYVGFLHMAALAGHEHVTRWLLEQGADPNKTGGNENFTPLHMAHFNRNVTVDADPRREVIQLLLAAGANPDAKSRRTARHAYERSPRDWADDYKEGQDLYPTSTASAGAGGSGSGGGSEEATAPVALPSFTPADRTPPEGTTFEFLEGPALDARRAEIIAVLMQAGSSSGAVLERPYTNSTKKSDFAAMAKMNIEDHLDLAKEEGGLVLVGKRAIGSSSPTSAPVVFVCVLLPGDSMGLKDEHFAAFGRDTSGYSAHCKNMGALAHATGVEIPRDNPSAIMMLGVTGTLPAMQKMGIATAAARHLKEELPTRGVMGVYGWMAGESGRRCCRGLTRSNLACSPLVAHRSEPGTAMDLRFFHLPDTQTPPEFDGRFPVFSQGLVQRSIPGGYRLLRTTPFYGREETETTLRTDYEAQFKAC